MTIISSRTASHADTDDYNVTPTNLSKASRNLSNAMPEYNNYGSISSANRGSNLQSFASFHSIPFHFSFLGGSPNNNMYRMPYQVDANSSGSMKRSNSMQLLRSPYVSPYNSLSRQKFAANYSGAVNAGSNPSAFDAASYIAERARSDAIYEQVRTYLLCIMHCIF